MALQPIISAFLGEHHKPRVEPLRVHAGHNALPTVYAGGGSRRFGWYWALGTARPSRPEPTHSTNTHGGGTRTCKLWDLVNRGVVRDGLVRVDDFTDYGIGIQRIFVILHLKYSRFYFFSPHPLTHSSASCLFNGRFDSCPARVFSPRYGPGVVLLSRRLA